MKFPEKMVNEGAISIVLSLKAGTKKLEKFVINNLPYTGTYLYYIEKSHVVMKH